MLTLKELKQIADAPIQGQRSPTAKSLRESRAILVRERIDDGEITVFQNGYVLYSAGGYTTVFSIHSCKEYMYETNSNTFCIQEQYFDKQAWYVRLVLEGEDRLSRNCQAKESNRIVSYSSISEEWHIMNNENDLALERMIREETLEELFVPLTEQQRIVILQYYFHQKTQEQIAIELGVSVPAVSRLLTRAIQRLQKKYNV